MERVYRKRGLRKPTMKHYIYVLSSKKDKRFNVYGTFEGAIYDTEAIEKHIKKLEKQLGVKRPYDLKSYTMRAD